MTSPIDPIRRAARLRRTRKSDVDGTESTDDSGAMNLPVPVDAAGVVPPKGGAEGVSIFAAQLIGQDGQKRGLRAGGLIDQAKGAYNRAEWSGAYDRRARKGRITKAEI